MSNWVMGARLWWGLCEVCSVPPWETPLVFAVWNCPISLVLHLLVLEQEMKARGVSISGRRCDRSFVFDFFVFQSHKQFHLGSVPWYFFPYHLGLSDSSFLDFHWSQLPKLKVLLTLRHTCTYCDSSSDVSLCFLSWIVLSCFVIPMLYP